MSSYGSFVPGFAVVPLQIEVRFPLKDRSVLMPCGYCGKGLAFEFAPPFDPDNNDGIRLKAMSTTYAEVVDELQQIKAMIPTNLTASHILLMRVGFLGLMVCAGLLALWPIATDTFADFLYQRVSLGGSDVPLVPLLCIPLVILGALAMAWSKRRLSSKFMAVASDIEAYLTGTINPRFAARGLVWSIDNGKSIRGSNVNSSANTSRKRIFYGVWSVYLTKVTSGAAAAATAVDAVCAQLRAAAAGVGVSGSMADAMTNQQQLMMAMQQALQFSAAQAQPQQAIAVPAPQPSTQHIADWAPAAPQMSNQALHQPLLNQLPAETSAPMPQHAGAPAGTSASVSSYVTMLNSQQQPQQVAPSYIYESRDPSAAASNNV